MKVTKKILKSFQAGFTVVELLAVIAIIGILVTLTIVSYAGYQNRTNDAAVKSNLQMIASGLDSFRNHNNHYPSNATELAALDIKVNPKSYSKAIATISLTYCTNYEQRGAVTPAYGMIARSVTGKIFFISHKFGATVQEVDSAVAATWSGSGAGIWCAARADVKRFDPTVSAYYEASTGYNYFTDGNWAGFK